MTIPLVIPSSTEGRVRLPSTAVPKDFRPHSSDGALMFSSSLMDNRGRPFSFYNSLPTGAPTLSLAERVTPLLGDRFRGIASSFKASPLGNGCNMPLSIFLHTI